MTLKKHYIYNYITHQNNKLSDVLKQWKHFIIIPVHKKGNIDDALNYKPTL